MVHKVDRLDHAQRAKYELTTYKRVCDDQADSSPQWVHMRNPWWKFILWYIVEDDSRSTVHSRPKDIGPKSGGTLHGRFPRASLQGKRSPSHLFGNATVAPEIVFSAANRHTPAVRSFTYPS